MAKDVSANDFLNFAALHQAKSISSICPAQGRSNWGATATRVKRLAGHLNEQGIGKGDRVAILAKNSAWHMDAVLAVLWAGAVLTPVNTRLNAASVRDIVLDSDAKLLIADSAFADFATTAVADSGCEVSYLGDEATTAGLPSLSAGSQNTEPLSLSQGEGDDLAILAYTGGTTGKPKGVMLSHRSLWSATMTSTLQLGFSSQHVYIHAAPLFHMADLGLLFSTTAVGASNVFMLEFTPDTFIQCVQEHEVTHSLLVPSMIGMVIDSPAFPKEGLSTLRQIFYGASPISLALLERTLEFLPQTDLVQGYGQTEICTGATILMPEHHSLDEDKRHRLRSCGRAQLHCRIKIIDDDGSSLPSNTVGQVAVTGPNVMQGYWKLPELTRTTLVDGWVRTGDMGYLDDDGFLYIVDRAKDMIISGGENVFSQEVETIVSKHPLVKECAVIGVPSEKWGESVHAAVVLKNPEAELQLETLIEFCRQSLGGFQVPRSLELIPEQLPLTGTGKVDKNALRSKYWQEAERNVG